MAILLFVIVEIDGLMQDCRNSSALAMELLQSGTKPSKWYETMIFILLLFVHQMELDHQRARFKDDLNLVNAENQSLKVKIEELKGDVVSLDWLRFSMFTYCQVSNIRRTSVGN